MTDQSSFELWPTIALSRTTVRSTEPAISNEQFPLVFLGQAVECDKMKSRMLRTQDEEEEKIQHHLRDSRFMTTIMSGPSPAKLL